MSSQQPDPPQQAMGAGESQQQPQQERQQQRQPQPPMNSTQWANAPVTGSVASMAFNKHWSSLFRRPVDDSHQQPQQPQRQHSQPAPGAVDSSNTYTFLQTKLLASTKDLAKLISDTSNRFDRDHDGVNKLLEECRGVIKSLAEKSVTRDSQHSDVGTAPFGYLF
jgi:hypothetical protein